MAPHAPQKRDGLIDVLRYVAIGGLCLAALSIRFLAAPSAATRAAEPTPVPTAPAARDRLDPLTEAEHAVWLRAQVRELDLHRDGDASKLYAQEMDPMLKILADARETAPKIRGWEGTLARAAEIERAPALLPACETPFRALLQRRTDFAGLAFQLGDKCRTNAEAARNLASASGDIRRKFLEEDERIKRSGLPNEAVEQTLGNYQPEAVPALEQIVAGEEQPRRIALVRMLKEMKAPVATAALARRAVFDLSVDVRREAVDALRERPAKEYRPVLVASLQHTWAPAACHAAEALIALKDQEALPALVALLDLPDPNRPFQQNGKWAVRELVRVNHLRNCLMCHPASVTDRDVPRGLIPTPGKEIPVVYYNSREGEFVRADVVYLRQDFSTLQPVEKAKPWPAKQRYDYLVQTTELSEKQARAWAAKMPACSSQRQAVLTALRALSGIDGGTTSAGWRTALAVKR